MINAVNTIDIKQLDEWDTWGEELAESGLDISPMVNRSVDAIYRYLCEGFTFQIQYSAGKDSETVLGLFLLALTRAKRQGIEVSPHHFAVHVDTGIENPEIRTLADSKIAALDSFIAAHNLPLKTYIARPSLASAWASRIIGGRGLPTFVSTKFRQCTHELKITGANRVVNQHKKSMPKEMTKKVVMLLGSRDDEGTIRKNNIAKLGGEECTISKSGNKYSLYPIKSWTSANVWEFLTYSGTRASSVLPSYLDDHFKTVDLYRDSGAGECVVFQADDQDGGSGQGSCGSRHGCAFCLASGVDKSMLTLLDTDPERYSYMIGLNRIQRYLELTRHDWDLRHPVGRTIYEGGFIKIQPDVYSPSMLKRLLHAVISYDYLEQKRAEELKEKLVWGKVEATPHNIRMSEPQFQIIDERQLVAIEFLWGLHHFQKLPFEALEIWHKVYQNGELELLDEVDTMVAVPKTPQPKPFWLHVGKWGDGTDLDGLTDFWTQMTYFEAQDSQASREIKTKDGMAHVVDYVEADLFEVDLETAKFIVWNEYPDFKKRAMDGRYTPYYSAAYLLRFGAVEIGKGQSARYHEMAQRGQTYHRLGLTGQLSMADIANDPAHAEHIMIDADYKFLAEKVKAENAIIAAVALETQKKEEALVAKRKAWAKANPKAAAQAKKLKKVISANRKSEQSLRNLFTMATSIHAVIQVDTIKGEGPKAIKRATKVLGGLGREIAELREWQNDKYQLKFYEFQLYTNKLWLSILDSGDLEQFDSNHIQEYAELAPDQLRAEFLQAIANCEKMIESIKPVKNVAHWYEGNGQKVECPTQAAAKEQIKTVAKAVNDTMQMNFDVFLSA